MATSWSQQELESLRKRLEGSSRSNQGPADEPARGPARGPEEEFEPDEALARACDACEREAAADGAGEVVSLDALLEAAGKGGASAIRLVLARVAQLFVRANDPVKAAISAKVAAFVDRTARRLYDSDAEGLEGFLFSVEGALRATSILAGNPLGGLLSELRAAEGGEEADEKEAATTAAKRLIERLLGRASAADAIVDRLLAANLTVADRFESLIDIPERMLDFDRRFRLASAFFPGLEEAGTDGESLGGYGKFGWVLGLDRSRKAREWQGISEEIEFAIELASAAPAAESDDVGLTPLPGFESKFIPQSTTSGTLEPLEIRRGSRYAALGGAAPGRRAAARVSEAAAKAVRTRDVQALEAAYGGRLSRTEAVAILGTRAPMKVLERLADTSIGRMDHVALGYQTMAAAEARPAAAPLADRIFGRIGATRTSRETPLGAARDRRAAYVSTPSATYMPHGTPFLTESASPAARRSADLASSLTPAARRALALSSPDLALFGRTVPAYAIASDGFGIPRFRGASRIPAQAFRSLEGFALSGSVVESAPRAPRYADFAGYDYGYAPPTEGVPPQGEGFRPVRDELGIVRLERAPRGIGGTIDLGRASRRRAAYAPEAYGLTRAEQAYGLTRPEGAYGFTQAEMESLELGRPAASAAREYFGEILGARPYRAYQAPLAPTQLYGRVADRGMAAAPPTRAQRTEALAPTAEIRRARAGYEPTAAAALARRAAYEPAYDRPAILAKYYAAAESRRLALGRTGDFRLASFGGASELRRRAEALAPAEVPLSLARFYAEAPYAPPAAGRFALPPIAGAVPAERPWRRSEIAIPPARRTAWTPLSAAAPARGAYRGEELGLAPIARWPVAWDEAGYAPATRLGRFAQDIEAHSALADGRYGRLGRTVEALRTSYSGERLRRDVPLDFESLAPRAAAASEPAPRPLPASRLAAPRLEGVYGVKRTYEPTEGDVLGLRRGGFEAARAPSAVVSRYRTTGFDQDVAPLARRREIAIERPEIATRARRALESGTAIAPRAAQAEGLDQAYVAPRSEGAPRMEPLPAYEDRRRPSLEAQAEIGLRRGPVNRFASVLEESPRETPRARTGATPAAKPRGRFDDRFSLDAWATRGPRAYAGELEPVSVAGAVRRTPEIGVAGEVVRYRRPPAELGRTDAAVPVDLTSLLTGRSEVVAATAGRGRERMLDLATRNLATPLGTLTSTPARRAKRSRRLEGSEVSIGRAPEGVEDATPTRRLHRSEIEMGAARPISRRGETADLAAPEIAARREGPALRTDRPTRARAAAPAEDMTVPAASREGAPALDRGEPVLSPRHRAPLGPSSFGYEADFSEASETADLIMFKRSGARSPGLAVEPDTRLGAQIRQDRGRPLSKPVLNFMEHFFKTNLSKVRVHEGTSAQALNRDLESEAFTAGNDVFLGRAAVSNESQRLGLIAHEVKHVVDNRAAETAHKRMVVQTLVTKSERRAREIEREIVSATRDRVRQAKTPKLSMEMTGVGQRSQEEQVPQQPAIQKKGTKFADTAVQMIEATGERLAKPWEALFPRAPRRDMTPLVYQIWNKIKRELAIDRERRAGGF